MAGAHITGAVAGQIGLRSKNHRLFQLAIFSRGYFAVAGAMINRSIVCEKRDVRDWGSGLSGA